METLCYVVMGFCVLKIACIVLEIIFNPDNETPEDEDEG